MIKQEFTFMGSQKNPMLLHAVIWQPEYESVEKVLQITHGMTEHIGRYEKLAEKLTAKGIAVAGFDLRGHGLNKGEKTIASFEQGGWLYALEDMHVFYEFLKDKFSGAKHYMLGFSLGSFLLREYLNQYAKDHVDGAIIMGTGHQPAAVLNIIVRVVAGEIKKVGWDDTTPLVKNLSFGTYNKKFKPNRTVSDWLCADEKELDKYIADGLCCDDISAGLFEDLLLSMKRTGSKDAYANWRKDMPVLLLSGKDDPVGDMGKGVQNVYTKMKKSGLEHVRIHLLNGARHDILHEYKSDGAEGAIRIIEEWMLEKCSECLIIEK